MNQKKVKRIECIDLSSDEDNDDKAKEEGSDDEIEYMDSVVSSQDEVLGLLLIPRTCPLSPTCRTG